MNVYELYPDANVYQGFYVDKSSLEKLILCNGDSFASSWVPLRVFLNEDESKKPKGDFPASITGLICNIVSQRAVDLLGDILLANGELLPLIYEEEEDTYFAYNVTNIIDVLDKEETQRRNRSSITRPAFCLDKIGDNIIFKVPETRLVRTYVTDGFIEKVQATPLTGFKFRHLWPPTAEPG